MVLTLILGFVAYLVFRDKQEYDKAVNQAKDAAKEAVEWAEKARQKYEDIQNRGDKIIGRIAEIATRERQKSLEVAKKVVGREAERQRRITELWSEGLRALKENRYEDSSKYWQEITSIKPDDYEAWNNWGGTLIEQARKKEGSEADKLYSEAYTKLQEALKIKPDHYKAWSNWGVTLLKLAQKKDGQEKQKLIQEAKEKCLRAEQIKKGEGVYNLACIAATEENEDECKKQLKVGEEAKTLPIRKHAMKDDDLKAYRDKDWFKAIKWRGER